MATPESTRPLTARQVAIRDAYLSGASMEKIAADMGINIGTVHYHLKRAGVASRSNRKDIPAGTRFGALVVLRYLGNCAWVCRCDCGREEVANATGLRRGAHVRCAACRRPETPPETKRCRKCGVEYPNTAEFFTRNRQFRLGLRAICKGCTNPVARAEGRKLRRSLRMEVLSHYSGGQSPSCACCGESTFEFLALDHMEGSSREDYRSSPGSTKLFARIKREGYRLRAQVLCHNCNAAVAHHGACPHRPDIVRPIKLRKTVAPLSMPADHAGAVQQCIHCKALLPLTAEFFHRNKPMPSGLTTVCRACANAKRSKAGYPEREAQRRAVLHHYSNGSMSCACCACDTFQFLTIDHVGGGGQEHRAQVKGPMYRHLFNNGFPSDVPLRVLCFNCNQADGFYGRCPHTVR